MSKKPSEAQRKVLERLAARKELRLSLGFNASAWTIPDMERVRTDTVFSLIDKGLIQMIKPGLYNSIYPQEGTYTITDTGRAALESAKEATKE